LAKDAGELPGALGVGNDCDNLLTAEGHAVEELEGADVDVEGGPRDLSLLDQVELVRPEVLRPEDLR
jgi:hypothetical protein